MMRRVPLWLLLLAAPVHAAPVTLAEAVREATTAATAVRLAGERGTQAEQRSRQARAALLPSLGASASQSERTFNLRAQGFPLPPGTPDVIGPIDGVDARVRVSQTLFDAAAWQRWRAAGSGSVAGRADLDAAAEAAATGGALAWLRAARAAALLDARRLDLLLAHELLRLAREQHAAGVSPAIDTTRARTQVVASQAGLLMAGNQLERARLDLARALGRDPADAPMPSDTLETASAITDAPLERAATLAFARTHRPELAAESARLERARRDAGATGLERLPRLDVAADWGLSGQTTDDWLHTRTFAIGLAWPVFDGLRREGRLSEQRSLAREAEWRLRDTEQQVTADVDAALLDLASGREQHEVARERLRLAEEEVLQASERFRNGIAGNIEVINAQLSLLRARDAEIDARFGWAAARVALARAAGVARGIR